MIENPSKAALLMKDAILKGVDPLPSLKEITLTEGRLNVYNSMAYLHNYCLANISEREAGTFENRYIGREKDIINIYPNPTSDFLKIEYTIEEFSDFKVNITNLLGQKVLAPVISETKPFNAQSVIVDVKNLSAGTYFITINQSAGKTTLPFIKI